MSAAVAMSALPFTTRHGDRKFRIGDREARRYEKARKERQREAEGRTLAQERERNPPPTVAFYRHGIRVNAPERARELTPEGWAAIERAVRVACAGRGVPPEERFDFRQELALRLLRSNEPLESVDAWLLTLARHLVVDWVREQAQEREARGVIYSLSTRNNRSLDEDTMIRHIDESRGRVPLTKDPDLEFFWDDVHTWCAARFRERFGRSWVGAGELTPQQLIELHVEGRQLAPDEATWVRLLSMPACPENLNVYSDTKPKDVFDQVYETVKKAFQRAAAKKSTCVSPETVRDNRLYFQGTEVLNDEH
jgi:hypothetical protein